MNSFGRIFRISIFGESHNNGVGILLDGVPSGIPLTEDDLLSDLARRKAGKKGTTPRIEQDLPEIVNGTFNGYTTGAPIMIFFKNQNTRSRDYSQLLEHPRPGHADFVANQKYNGFHDYRGGGHFSGRLTLGIVAAGVVAKKILPEMTKITATLKKVGGCLDIDSVIDQIIDQEDSTGGLIECIALNPPISIGEPFFDSAESIISHMIFAIPAIKGIEFGTGFQLAEMRGSQANDPIVSAGGATETNHCGGINGGITNGNPIEFRVVVKPTSSIGQTQNTFNLKEQKVEPLTVVGRHDACIALRMPVIIEAVTAIALADLMMIQNSIHGGK